MGPRFAGFIVVASMAVEWAKVVKRLSSGAAIAYRRRQKQ